MTYMVLLATAEAVSARPRTVTATDTILLDNIVEDPDAERR